MGELVKYHNDLNTVSMRNWTKDELNIFFAIVAKAKDQGTKKIKLERSEIKELANYTNRHSKDFYKTIEKLVDTVGTMRYKEKTSNSIEVMPLFKRFKAYWSDDLSEMALEIIVNDEFEYILNKLEARFTIYELQEFTQIRSTYAKTMYRLLKQWRTKGSFKINLEDFRYILGVAKSYKSIDIDKRVLKPIEEQLSPYFNTLKINKIKLKKRGNPVSAYEFTWKPETPKKKLEKIDVPKENNIRNTKRTEFEPNEMIRISKQLMGFED